VRNEPRIRDEKMQKWFYVHSRGSVATGRRLVSGTAWTTRSDGAWTRLVIVLPGHCTAHGCAPAIWVIGRSDRLSLLLCLSIVYCSWKYYGYIRLGRYVGGRRRRSVWKGTSTMPPTFYSYTDLFLWSSIWRRWRRYTSTFS
jgi:hypothetical protein